jgi:L-asparaginase/Glu-tRNA(Gln) amidotransferase subunit D
LESGRSIGNAYPPWIEFPHRNVRECQTIAGDEFRACRARRQLAAAWMVAADNLSPQKAAWLLRLALPCTRDPDTIQRMFDEY